MGLFKNIFDTAVDAMKEAVEQSKAEYQERFNQRRNEIQESLNQRKNGMQERKELLKGSLSSNSEGITYSSEVEKQTEYGVIKNGTLKISEGITELKDGSLSKFKSLKKVIFPASLTNLETHVFEDNAQLEELDFSRVTKLEYLPDAFIFGDSNIKELKIPYGVTHVGSAVVCDVDRTHPLEVYVPATVRKFEPFDANHAVTFNLFSSHIDIEWLISDAKQFYVLEKDISNYKSQMEEYGGNVPVGVMMDRYAAFYSELIYGPEKENEKEEKDSSSANRKNKKVQTTSEDTITFSPRIEALIKSAFRDGVITKKEKEIIIKRAIIEGEDADEFEMLLDSRIADNGIKEE